MDQPQRTEGLPALLRRLEETSAAPLSGDAVPALTSADLWQGDLVRAMQGAPFALNTSMLTLFQASSWRSFTLKERTGQLCFGTRPSGRRSMGTPCHRTGDRSPERY